MSEPSEEAVQAAMRYVRSQPLLWQYIDEQDVRGVLDALAGAGFSLVLTGDLRAYLYRGVDLSEGERAAMNRLREAAGPERTDHA